MSNTLAKRRGAEIERLQKRIHEMKMDKNDHKMTVTKPSKCYTPEDVTEYVRSVMAPEGMTPLRYQDQYCEETSIYQAIINEFIPIMTQDSIGVRKGDFYMEVHPELDNTVVYLSEEIGALALYQGALTAQKNNFGLFNDNGRPTVPDGDGMVLRTDEGPVNVVMPIRIDGVLQVPKFSGPSNAPVSSTGYWYVNSSSNDVAHWWRLANPGIEDLDFTISYIAADGGVIVTHTQTIPAHSNATVYAGGAPGPNTDYIIPQTPRGIYSYKVIISVDHTNVSGITSSLNVREITWFGGTLDYWYASFNVPDLDILIADVEKYRTTALSALVTYKGSTLTNAGDVAAIHYRGGIPAQYNQVFDYESVAEHPLSYDGRLSDGAYGYFQPQDPVDMSFRATTAINVFKRPYLIITGRYGGDPTTGDINTPDTVVRLRAVMNLEFSSKSQMYDLKPSPVCPGVITHGNRLMSGIPNVMENGKHLDKLRNFFKSAAKHAASAIKFGWDHRAEIEKAATTLAPLLAL